MKPALYITAFRPAQVPVTDLVTKFGGQPVWLSNPTWPLHPTTGEPLPFLGQVRLEPEVFGEISAQMAYLFYGVQNENTDFIDWDAYSIVLQPGEYDQPSVVKSNGPGIETMCKAEVDREVEVVLEPRSDPEFPDDDQLRGWDDDQVYQFSQSLYGTKLGGSPALYTHWMAPDDGLEPWNLLLQLDGNTDFQCPYPTGMDDSGLVWFFISKDGLRTAFGVGESDY